jgi:hypothetical protein
MKYVLGIDGGGTKLELCLADLSGRSVERVRLDQPCNPWSSGVDSVAQTIRDGLNHFKPYHDDIVHIVAGIGGMLEHNQYTDRLQAVLKEVCPDILLTGDLLTSFRAGTDSSTGIMAICGTGSSIALFTDTALEPMVFDGVGTSGRELSLALARACQRGTIGAAGAAYLRHKAPAIDSLSTTHELYHDPSIKTLSSAVAELAVTSDEFKDMQPIIDTAVDRWRFKLYGYSRLFLQYQQGVTKIPIIIDGGVWNFDYFRTNITQPLVTEFPEIQFLFDKHTRPVDGAVRMALDLYKR